MFNNTPENINDRKREEHLLIYAALEYARDRGIVKAGPPSTFLCAYGEFDYMRVKRLSKQLKF